MKVGIIGGTGYTGGELLRILAKHPEAEVVAVSSRKVKGKKIHEVHPHLKGFYDIEFVDPTERVFSECDVVFTAVPHGEAMRYVPELYESGVKVIDLSADYRLKKDVYERVYGKKHEAYIEAVYGLPEIHREEIKKARLVANPGCYPTGTIPAVAPLADQEIVEMVVFDSKSGITGAGATPTDFTHYPNLHEAVVPYKITDHRHYYEMEQELKRFQEDIKISFTPQVFPGSRGILTNAHVFLRGDLDQDELEKLFRDFYRDCYFVRFQKTVRLSYVRGSNFIDISINKGSDRVVIVTAIDNLVKGASGQAVQNMNLMFGLDEWVGLDFPPLFP